MFNSSKVYTRIWWIVYVDAYVCAYFAHNGLSDYSIIYFVLQLTIYMELSGEEATKQRHAYLFNLKWEIIGWLLHRFLI